MMDKKQHRSTMRVLQIFEIISGNNTGITLTQLATIMDVPKSSLFMILSTLVNQKYLTLKPDSLKYFLGYKSLSIGFAYLDNNTVLNEITQQVKNVVNQCSETCHFAILDNGAAFYLSTVESPEKIRMVSGAGSRFPAYSTSLGKALLSYHTLAELKKMYPDGLKPVTENTIVDIKKLYSQIQQYKIEGIFYEKEESTLHIQCFAVPIVIADNCVAAVSVSVPIFRMSDEKLHLIKRLLKESKRFIEQLIDNKNIDFLSYL